MIFPFSHFILCLFFASLQPPHNIVEYELDHQYFGIRAEDGIISLKRSLLGDGTETYRV